jgi:hypothetical protein
MLASSFLAIFVIPALFYMIERLGGAGEHVKTPLPTPTPEPGD